MMSPSKRAALTGIVLLLAQFVADSAFADKKKDFKGLFGSYRREKYTENEGNDSEWGADIMLSTLYPISSMANTAAGVSNAQTEMPHTISFNVELNISRTFGYNTMVYFNTGHYSYDSRQQTQSAVANGASGTTGDITAITQYNVLNMSIIPLMLGVKYRFSRTDFVPYIGAAAGVSLMNRKITYNYSNLSHEDASTPLTVQGYGGFEFFFAPGAGLRVELGAWTAFSSQVIKDTGVTSVESIIFPANPIALRYASGVFFIF